MDKQYIIRISNKTFYRYGGNIRDINFATRFKENELQIAQNVTKLYKNAKIEELDINI